MNPAILGLTVLLLGTWPGWAKPPLDYQEPPPDPPAATALGRPTEGQLPGKVPPDRLVGPGLFNRLPSIDETQWVVVAVSDKPYWQVGTRDPVLTNACRLRDFGSLPLNRMVVRFTGEEGRGFLQVVPPAYRHLLIDSRKMARANETYYFLNTGLATCEVWVGGKAKLRLLNVKTGSSLPDPDPQALKKRKALINSWPHD